MFGNIGSLMDVDHPVQSLRAEAGGFTSGFVAALGHDPGPLALAEHLVAAVDRGRRAWPDIGGIEAAFVAALGRSLRSDADLPGAIDGLHHEDLWLATAAVQGHASAVAEFDAQLVALRPVVAAAGADRPTIDDTLQIVRARLLTGSAERPATLSTYGGRGDLRSWLKVVVGREAVARCRHARRHASGLGTDLDVLIDPHDDPELACMRERYGAEFRVAFSEALAMLEARERNLLRYSLIEQLTIDEIGLVYRVHRSTAARWLVRIRERLSVCTRDALAVRLSIGTDELDGVIRLIGSRLDASISRHLRDPD